MEGYAGRSLVPVPPIADVGEADQAHSGAGSPSVDPGHHWSGRGVERANEHVEDAGNLGDVLAAVRGCGERTDVAAGTEVCAFADQKDAPDVVSDCLERLRALNQSFVVEGGAVGGGGNGDAEYALVEGHFAQVIDGSHSTHITGVRQPYETRGHIDTATIDTATLIQLCPRHRSDGGRACNSLCSGNQPRATLPAFRQEVHTLTLRVLPGATSVRTD